MRVRQSLLDAVDAAERRGAPDLSCAFQACESLAELQAAAGQQSGALGDQDPQEYVEEQCAEAARGNSPLCMSVDAAPTSG